MVPRPATKGRPVCLKWHAAGPVRNRGQEEPGDHSRAVRWKRSANLSEHLAIPSTKL
jgi:hypothetical protein